MALGGVVILAATFLMINSQPPPLSEIPEQCRLPPQGIDRPYECCDAKPLFTQADYVECGFKNDKSDALDKVPDCSKQLCLMRKYNLLNMNNEIDKQRVGAFIDNWAAKYPAFIPAIAAAKEACLTGKPLPGPPQVCDANKMVVCFNSVVFNECPVWRDTPECGKVKAHVELCRRYFRKLRTL